MLEFLAFVNLLSITLSVDGAQIRLVNGNKSCSGRVEIYYNGQWGTVCDDGWDMNDAAVVCRQLGCGSAMSAESGAHFGQGSEPTWMDDVACTGSESFLTDCSHRGFGNEACSHTEDAGVVCSDPVRLVNGNCRCSGRVEIHYNGQWGTVCDDDWDMNDTAVVCKNLGCGSAVSAPKNAHFGQGSEPTWLDDVACTGTESYLTECKHSGYGIENCNHGEDAGVVCSGQMSNPTLSRVSSYSSFSPGEEVQFRCTTPTGVCPPIEFHLYKDSAGSPLAQINQSTDTSVVLTVSNVDTSHQGSYSCLYRIPGSQPISSPRSNSIDITIVSLPKPRISLSAREVTWGHSVDINCSITTVHSGGTCVLQKVSGSYRDTKSSSSNSATFTITAVNFVHEGAYHCQYQIRALERLFTSPDSDSVSFSVIVSLLKPHISVSAREVTWGHSVDITCSITTVHSGGTFVLQKVSGSLTETRNASPNSATFTFPAVDFVHHGAYHCQYKTRVSDRSFNSSHSDSVSFSVIVVLLQPNISLSDPAGGMIWGHQGPEVVRGSSFTITCSTPPQYPGGFFHLTFTGSKRVETQAAVDHSASFLFPAADYSHQGNYSCVYETTVSTHNFSSPQSKLLPLMVRASLVLPVISGMLTGLLLLLLVSAAIFLVCKKRRNNQEQVQKQTRNSCAMKTYSNRGEANEDENEEEDYVNAEVFNAQDDNYAEIKDDNRSEADYENFNQPQENDENIYIPVYQN